MTDNKAEMNRKYQKEWYYRNKNWDGVIYKITCVPEDSCYVGSTTNDVKKRWWQQKTDANKGKSGRLYDWIRLWCTEEFGDSMFEVEILERVDSGASIPKREAYWINELDSECNIQMKNREENVNLLQIMQYTLNKS